jgi:excinuclease ABC subunit A
MSDAWDELPDGEVRNAILFGTMDEEITFVYDDGLRSYKTTEDLRGRDSAISSGAGRKPIAPGCARSCRVTVRPPCQSCNGYRLKPEALAVKINGMHIGEVSRTVDPQRR